MDEFNPRLDEDRAYLSAVLVGFALGLRTQKILTGDRGSPVHARARHIAMYLAYAGLGMSMSRVAIGFGRDKSTAARACRVIEDYREDPDFDTWIDQLALGLRSVAVLVPGEDVA